MLPILQVFLLFISNKASIFARTAARPSRLWRNVLRFCSGSTRGSEEIGATRWSRIFCTAQPLHRAHSTSKPGHIALPPCRAGKWVDSVGVECREMNSRHCNRCCAAGLAVFAFSAAIVGKKLNQNRGYLGANAMGVSLRYAHPRLPNLHASVSALSR